MSMIHDLAAQAGFHACYLLPPDNFPNFERRRTDGVLHRDANNLVSNPRETLPWANALVLVLLAYRPYPPEAGVSGYYPASNRAYHAANGLVRLLTEAGIRSERVYVPVGELAIRSGLGTACQNGLTAFDGFGTRVIAQTLAARMPKVAYEPVRPRRCCPSCGRCAAACPARAIDGSGYHPSACARAYMEQDAMPDWVMDDMAALLGCELCQYACPLNGGIPFDADVPEAFALERLLAGEIKPALAIVGKNLNSGGRLLAHACVLAAHGNRRDLLPLILAYGDDPRPAVQSAARYAISRLQER